MEGQLKNWNETKIFRQIQQLASENNTEKAAEHALTSCMPEIQQFSVLPTGSGCRHS